MDKYILNKRKRTLSLIDNDINDINDKLINEFNNINFENNNALLKKIIGKIDNNTIEINKLNLKMESFQKSVDKILIEKDYIIENLKDELNNLKNDIKNTKYSIENNKINDYFL